MRKRKGRRDEEKATRDDDREGKLEKGIKKRKERREKES